MRQSELHCRGQPVAMLCVLCLLMLCVRSHPAEPTGALQQFGDVSISQAAIFLHAFELPKLISPDALHLHASVLQVSVTHLPSKAFHLEALCFDAGRRSQQSYMQQQLLPVLPKRQLTGISICTSCCCLAHLLCTVTPAKTLHDVMHHVLLVVMPRV